MPEDLEVASLKKNQCLLQAFGMPEFALTRCILDLIFLFTCSFTCSSVNVFVTSEGAACCRDVKDGYLLVLIHHY